MTHEELEEGTILNDFAKLRKVANCESDVSTRRPNRRSADRRLFRPTNCARIGIWSLTNCGLKAALHLCEL